QRALSSFPTRRSSDLPSVQEEISHGDLGSVCGWLREHVWRHGRRFEPGTLLERAVGTGIDPCPYVNYLRDKFGARPEPAPEASLDRKSTRLNSSHLVI